MCNGQITFQYKTDRFTSELGMMMIMASPLYTNQFR